MSRIGKQSIAVPPKVTVKLERQKISVDGPKGNLSRILPSVICCTLDEKSNQLVIEKAQDTRLAQALYGLSRTLVSNMVTGVSDGFSKDLEIIGVGYNAEVQGKRLKLQLGFSHDIFFDMPDGITITANRTEVKVEGIDKQLVGAVAAKIRSFRKPEPYKGKGVRYKNEYVRSKQGKTVGAK